MIRAILALAALAAITLRFVPIEVTRPLDTASIAHRAGHAFTASTANLLPRGIWASLLDVRSDSNTSPRASQLRLTERGNALAPAHSMHADIETYGSGRFSHWGETVIFAASDNTNPLTNGRAYAVTYPLAPSGWIVVLLLAALGAGPALRGSRAVAIALREARPWQQVNLRAAFTPAWLLLFAVAAINPVLWLATLPPSWNYIDSVVVMLTDLASGVIPHYPPLYPLASRAVNFVVSHLFVPGAPTLGPWVSGNLTDASLYTGVVLQHLYYVFAVLFFAAAAARTPARRLVVVLSFLLAPALSLYNHGVFSEGPWVSAVIMVFAACLVILRTERVTWWHGVLYFCAWIPALLLRHVAIVFAFMLPATLLALALLERGRRREYSKRCALAVGASLAALLAAGLLTRAACWMIDVEYRAIEGRSGVYHITMVDWPSVPAAEREALTESLRRRASSPLVADAVPIVMASRDPWSGTWNEVRQFVRSRPPAELAGRDSGVVTDEILNEVSSLYRETLNPWYRQRVRATLEAYWVEFMGLSQPDHVLRAGIQSLDLYSKSFTEYFRGVRAVDPAGKARFEAMLRSGYLHLADWWPDSRRTLALALVLALALFFRLPAAYALLTLFGLLNLAIYFLLISALTTIVTRYGLATTLVTAPLTGLVLANLQLPPSWRRRMANPTQ